MPKATSRTYHFEDQSTPDGRITVRIFEYASQMAFEDASVEKTRLILEYIHSYIQQYFA